jgi:hypothetical protein
MRKAASAAISWGPRKMRKRNMNSSDLFNLFRLILAVEAARVIEQSFADNTSVSLETRQAFVILKRNIDEDGVNLERELLTKG